MPNGNADESETFKSSPRSRHEGYNSDFSDFSADDDGAKQDWERDPPCTLTLEYWKRTPDVQRLKDLHIDRIDANWTSREDLILQTTLRDEDVVLERNMFPYDTPANITHYTLWSIDEMSHNEICRFVEHYCQKFLPTAVEWNYEENSHRSIGIPHVHIFIKFQDDGERTQQTAAAGKRRVSPADVQDSPSSPQEAESADSLDSSPHRAKRVRVSPHSDASGSQHTMLVDDTKAASPTDMPISATPGPVASGLPFIDDGANGAVDARESDCDSSSLVGGRVEDLRAGGNV